MKTIGLFLLMVILIISLTNIAAMVSRGDGIPDVLTYFYPERFVDKEQETARETLMAPFAEADNASNPVKTVSGVAYDPLGGSVVVSETLDIPHRHEAAVSEWIVKALSEILTFNVSGYAAHKNDISSFMDVNAINELQSFIDTSNVLGLMQSRNFNLRSFVRDIPEMLTSGAVDGRYRWVYDVPVSLTFLPVGAANYKEMKKDDYMLEELTFRVQLGRVADGGREGIAIETWELLKKKAK